MARGVKFWVAGLLAVCLLISLAYLPPRGVPKWAEGRIYRGPEPNPQRLRARDLLTKWQVANAALLGAQYHDRLTPLLAAQRHGDHPGPELVLETDSATRRWGEAMISGALDSAWKRLDLGVTKISIGVLMQNRPAPTERTGPGATSNGLDAVYLLPDSTDRATCLVVAPTPFFAINRNHMPEGRLVSWAIGVLGPCAYYARFGVPSPRVEQWLAARQFDVAITPNWYRRQQIDRSVNWRLWFSLNERESWWGIYSYSPMVLACLAGRPEACRQSLANSDRAGGRTRPRVVVPYDPWDERKVQLIAADAYLADMVHAVGVDRFQDFWTTTLPIDSAVTVAVGKPAGEYTVSWLRGFSVAPHFGAATTWLNAALGLAFAALLIGLVVLGQGRREVR